MDRNEVKARNPKSKHHKGGGGRTKPKGGPKSKAKTQEGASNKSGGRRGGKGKANRMSAAKKLMVNKKYKEAIKELDMVFMSERKL